MAHAIQEELGDVMECVLRLEGSISIPAILLTTVISRLLYWMTLGHATRALSQASQRTNFQFVPLDARPPPISSKHQLRYVEATRQQATPAGPSYVTMSDVTKDSLLRF